MSIVPKLGARYRYYLQNIKPTMKLIIRLLNIDNNSEIRNYEIKAVHPVYYHPNKHTNTPICLKVFREKKWEAKLTFGYAPTDRQYEFMGLTPPDRNDPYYVSLPKQGLDLIINKRVLKFHLLCELGLANVNHSKFNYFRGEVELVKGFKTATTKNDIISNANYEELKKSLYNYFSENGWLQGYKSTKDLPETLLRDRLKNFLLSNPLSLRKTVITEYPIKKINSYIDIFADGEAWELKKDIANAVNVFQLFGYMEIENINLGYLVAPDFGEGAIFATKFIEEKYNRKIILAKLEDFPINQEPNEYELIKYYPQK